MDFTFISPSRSAVLPILYAENNAAKLSFTIPSFSSRIELINHEERIRSDVRRQNDEKMQFCNELA